MNTISMQIRYLFTLLGLFLAASVAAAPSVNQALVLAPGWNAVYVEVAPASPDLSAIFGGTDVQSVWAYEDSTGSPDFIQEVTEATLAKTGWISWVQTNRVDAFQNDLFQLQVNRAYLVKNAGTNPLTISLSGRPSLRKSQWHPNTFNFRGFPVDPGFAPTFLNFLKASSAHYSPATGLQPIYKLSATGAWQLVAPTDLMASGAAYWVFCKGSSDFMAPLTVTTDISDGLDFGTIATELPLNLRNLTAGAQTVTITDVNAPADNPLSYADRAADATLSWPAYVSPLLRSLSANELRVERIALRRANIVGDFFETVLQVIDGTGSRLYVPISASRENSSGVVASASKKGSKARTVAASAHAGLWVGTVTLNAVSEAHSGTLVTNISQGFTVTLETNIVTGAVTTNQVPNSVTRMNISMETTPTGSEFRLRLLLHVDGSGQTRLLKEVIQMWQDGSVTTATDGTVTTIPGRAVLVTDETKLSQFVGINPVGGSPTGRRLSTAAFDFVANELPMGGDFTEGGSVRGTNTMSADFATNPFKHRYHPDHQSGYDIKRIIQLDVSPPTANASPGYGDRILEGAYQETVTGLHRTNIVVSGVFRLNRISPIATLNQ